MTEESTPLPPSGDAPKPAQLSEEFYFRVNDILERAKRIEDRYDTHHAGMVMLHAFARYSAHHYLRTEKDDRQESREAFALYIAQTAEELVMGHIRHLRGEPKAAEGAEPAAE
jgi:hypothetical protein